MLRIAAVLLVLGVAGCSGKTIPLPAVEADDPVSQLNPGRWQATVNDLMLPPGDGSPQPLPAPVPTGASMVPQR